MFSIEQVEEDGISFALFISGHADGPDIFKTGKEI
jgi:hypothetical protein